MCRCHTGFQVGASGTDVDSQVFRSGVQIQRMRDAALVALYNTASKVRCQLFSSTILRSANARETAIQIVNQEGLPTMSRQIRPDKAKAGCERTSRAPAQTAWPAIVPSLRTSSLLIMASCAQIKNFGSTVTGFFGR